MYNLEMLPRGQTVLASDSQLLIWMKPGSPAVFTIWCLFHAVGTDYLHITEIFFASFSPYNITGFHFILKFVLRFEKSIL